MTLLDPRGLQLLIHLAHNPDKNLITLLALRLRCTLEFSSVVAAAL